MATASKQVKILTEEQVMTLIRDEQKSMSVREYAAKIGISAAYLSDIFNGHRSPGKKIMEHFGLKKRRVVTVTYTFTR